MLCTRRLSSFAAPFHKKYFPAAARCARQTGFAKGRAGADKAPRRIAGKGGGTAGFRFHPAAKRRANPPAARFALHTPAAAGNRRPQGLAICFLLRLRLTVSAGHGPLAAACRRKHHGARCKQASIGGVVRHAHHGAPRGIFAHKGGGSGLCLIVQPFEGLV